MAGVVSHYTGLREMSCSGNTWDAHAHTHAHLTMCGIMAHGLEQSSRQHRAWGPGTGDRVVGTKRKRKQKKGVKSWFGRGECREGVIHEGEEWQIMKNVIQALETAANQKPPSIAVSFSLDLFLRTKCTSRPRGKRGSSSAVKWNIEIVCKNYHDNNRRGTGTTPRAVTWVWTALQNTISVLQD